MSAAEAIQPLQFEPQAQITEPVTPADFAWIASRKQWQPADHLLLLDEYLVQVAEGNIKRLMIFMPPRHGKSELTSKYFPAWYLGTYPDKRVMLASYEADFAASWGEKAKDLLLEYGKSHFGIELARKKKARNRWGIQGHSGEMVTAGVGGALTGKGCDILIIDDPVKNAEEANSKTYRKKTLEWYKSTAFTRLEPEGAVIIIQTRWHEEDLSGALLGEEADKWTVISLPAFAGENDPLGRLPGEPLFPKRFNEKALNDIKETLGPYWFSALYQQTPQPESGSKFKREYFRYATFENGIFQLKKPTGMQPVALEHCSVFQTCDPAASTEDTADYFVLATWVKTPDNDLILFDLVHTRLEGPDQPALFQQAYTRHKPLTQWVETNSIGKTLFQTLVKEGLPVQPLTADRDKMTRAIPAAVRMQAGTIYFLEDVSYLYEVEEELLHFPTGKHDDIVDNVAYAAQIVIEGLQGDAEFDLNDLMGTRQKR